MAVIMTHTSIYAADVAAACSKARPTAPPPIIYTHKTGDASMAMDWVKRYKAGQEERDIILSMRVCKGLEVDTALVLDITGGSGVENMVMRAVAGVILVTRKK